MARQRSVPEIPGNESVGCTDGRIHMDGPAKAHALRCVGILPMNNITPIVRASGFGIIILTCQFFTFSCTSTNAPTQSNSPTTQSVAELNLANGLAWTIGQAERRSSPRTWLSRISAIESKIRERDSRVRNLLGILRAQQNAGLVEFILVDVVAKRENSFDEYEYAMFYRNKGLSSADKTRISELDLIEIDEANWTSIRGLAQSAANAPGTGNSEILMSGLWNVVVVSFYDGQSWSTKAWFDLYNSDHSRWPVLTDMVFFRLLENVWVLQPAKEKCGYSIFGNHYFVGVLGEEHRQKVEQCIKAGKQWTGPE